MAIVEHVKRRRTPWFVGATTTAAAVLQLVVGSDLHQLLWG